MFVKPLSKYNKTTQKRYSLYQLCESYRLDGRIRHHVIIGFGKLEELPNDDQKILLGERIEEMLKGEQRLELEPKDKKVEELALHFYKEIIKKHSYDVKRKGTKWQTVDLDSIKNKDVKEIGAEWLCKQAFDQLNIGEFLQRQTLRNKQSLVPGKRQAGKSPFTKDKRTV